MTSTHAHNPSLSQPHHSAFVGRMESAVRRCWAGVMSALAGPAPVSRSETRPGPGSRVISIDRRRDSLNAAVRAVARRSVRFNGVLLSDALLPVVDHVFHRRVEDGAYWYDYVSGEWGVERRGRSGKIRHGLELGGVLKPDASGGKTGIFVNGREITSWESLRMRWAASFSPGRYWVDHNGNFGMENGPCMGNLRKLEGSRMLLPGAAS